MGVAPWGFIFFAARVTTATYLGVAVPLWGTMNYFQNIFQDVTGDYSSKRFVAIGSFLALVFFSVVDTFFGIVVKEYVFDAFVYIGGVALGTAAAEYFSPRYTNSRDYTDLP